MIKNILAVTLLFISVDSFAEDTQNRWRKLYESDIATVSIRPKDVSVVIGSNGNEVDYWLKITYIKKSNEFNIGDYTLSKSRVRCSDRMSKHLAIIAYRKNGISFANEETNEPYESIAPDSNLDGLADVLCPSKKE